MLVVEKDGQYLIESDSFIDLVEKKTSASNSWIPFGDHVAIELVKRYRKIFVSFDLLLQDNVKNKTKKRDIDETKLFDFKDLYEKRAKVLSKKMLFIGKRGCGKTYTISHFLDKYKEEFIENSLVISSSEKYAPQYSIKYPNAKILFEYNEDQVKEYLEKTKDMPGAIVLDDCVYGQKITEGSFLYNLIVYSETYNKKLFMSMQFPLGLSPELRTSFDYVFLFGDNVVSNQKRLYNHYAGMFPSFNLFRANFVNLTNDFSCMVVRKKRTNILQSLIFKFRANSHIPNLDELTPIESSSPSIIEIEDN